MEWINIDILQPQIDFEVICCIDDDVFLATFRESDTGYWFEQNTALSSDILFDVTHWQSLPDPPS